MANGTKDELISVREAARECGRNMETVRRWIWGGKLPAEKLGNQLFIKRSDFASFCREKATQKYQAEPKPDFLEREKHMNELEQRLREPEIKVKPGGKADLIKRMRKLRESIRARVGRDFTEDEIVDTIHKQREERINELSGLR
ncbi:helix-turn-helix domain-containing protein [Chloroflexota bacterium]